MGTVTELCHPLSLARGCLGSCGANLDCLMSSSLTCTVTLMTYLQPAQMPVQARHPSVAICHAHHSSWPSHGWPPGPCTSSTHRQLRSALFILSTLERPSSSIHHGLILNSAADLVNSAPAGRHLQA